MDIQQQKSEYFKKEEKRFQKLIERNENKNDNQKMFLSLFLFGAIVILLDRSLLGVVWAQVTLWTAYITVATILISYALVMPATLHSLTQLYNWTQTEDLNRPEATNNLRFIILALNTISTITTLLSLFSFSIFIFLNL